MRSGYESFLRRQLSKPRTPAPRWSDSVPAAVPGRVNGTAAPTPALDIIEETMPAILWRADKSTAAAPPITQAESLETISLAPPEPAATTTQAESSSPLPLDAAEVFDASDSRAGPPLDTQPAGEPAVQPEAATAAVQSAAPRSTAAPSSALDALLAEALAEARQQCGLGAAIRIGMARLDEVADAFGESAVNHVLRALRHRLRRLLADVAPRASVCTVGEALWIVLPGIARTSLAEALVRQVLEALTRPLTLRAYPVVLHGSAGLAVFPHDGMEPSAVRRAAEVAWRQARTRGRSAYQFYAREIESRARRRLAQEARLRQAITHDELSLHYQPRAEVRSGALCGAQALPSWTPEGQVGWNTPELLLLAQESGLGEALAHWSVGAACRQVGAWLAQGLPVPRIAVPVLPAPFRRDGFGRAAAAQARAVGVDPARITLVLSPVAPLTDGPRALGGLDLVQHAPHLRHCREAGFHLAMDGAATAGCSLAALRALPLSELHLDCALFDEAPTDADGGLGGAIVTLGHRLGLRVAASGVSDDAHLDRLASLGCDEFHGSLLSDPLPPQTWAEVMAGAHGRPER